MELSREEVEIFSRCGTPGECIACNRCSSCDITNKDAPIISTLAQQLLVEMDKNNMWDGKIDWDSRPWATEVRIAYCGKDCPPDHIGDRIFTIKRPKTKAREIAERRAYRDGMRLGWTSEEIAILTNDYEAAILEAQKDGAK